jgi:hypothetical protein
LRSGWKPPAIPQLKLLLMFLLSSFMFTYITFWIRYLVLCFRIVKYTFFEEAYTSNVLLQVMICQNCQVPAMDLVDYLSKMSLFVSPRQTTVSLQAR